MSTMSASTAAENETSTLLNGQRGGSPPAVSAGRGESFLICGSCNWTTSSQGNKELSVLCKLNGAGIVEAKEKMQILQLNAARYKSEMHGAGEILRMGGD